MHTGRIVRRVASASCISSCTHCEARIGGEDQHEDIAGLEFLLSVWTQVVPPERPRSSYQTSRLYRRW